MFSVRCLRFYANTEHIRNHRMRLDLFRSVFCFSFALVRTLFSCRNSTYTPCVSLTKRRRTSLRSPFPRASANRISTSTNSRFDAMLKSVLLEDCCCHTPLLDAGSFRAGKLSFPVVFRDDGCSCLGAWLLL